MGNITEQNDALKLALEVFAKEKALQKLHDENDRLGLYKDAYAEQKLEQNDKIKETYVRQYQERRNKWEVCVKFDSLEEALSFRNEIENPRTKFSIINERHKGIEKLNFTVRTIKSA